MRGFDGGSVATGALVAGSLVVSLALGVGSGLLASDRVEASRSAQPRPALEDRIPKLRQARQGARARLAEPQCRAVLEDFRSSSGMRLDEVLRGRGRTAQEQLDLLVLESGLGRPLCQRSVQLAFTQVGSSVVSICLRPFTLLPRRQQEAVLIHEMLHSLGLGEAPPDSREITARVLARCGR